MGDEVKELLHYIGGDKPSSTLTKLLDEEVNNVKSNKKWRREFMTLLMRDNENKLCKAKCMNRFFMHFILLYWICCHVMIIATIELGVYRNTYP